MKRYFYILLLLAQLLNLSSCSLSPTRKAIFYTELNHAKDPSLNTDQELCQSSQFEILVSDQHPILFKILSGANFELSETNNFFVQFFKQANIYEAFVFIHLLQMKINPERHSPFSTIQFVSSFPKKINHFSTIDHFKHKNETIYLLDFLKFLMLKHAKRFSFEDLSRIIDRELDHKIYISSEQAKFLKSIAHKNINSYFYQKYFSRNGLPLIENERRATPSLSQLKLFTQIDQKHLEQTIKLQEYTAPFCEFSKEENENAPYSIPMTISIRQGETILTSTSYFQYKFPFTSKAQPISKTQLREDFFDTILPTKNLPQCLFATKNGSVYLISTEGQHKEQHLSHLKELKFSETSKLSEIKASLAYSRHLFLTHPDRLLYETKRGRAEHIEKLLNLTIPFYHVENLGHILGFYLPHNGLVNMTNLLNDPRKKNVHTCR